MGNILNQTFTFRCILTILVFFLFLISHTSSSSSSSNNQEIQPQNQNPSSTIPADYHHQVFYLKNADPPMFLTRSQERVRKKKRVKRNKNNMMKKHRKKMIKNTQQLRSFSVMLPKGFVPPSGSSPCHNDQPNSVSSIHCRLTTTKP